jgi:hypothetical protein
MVGINKIRRLAYQTAVVGAAAAALSLTAAAHSSNSSANPFSRDRGGEILVITDHMTSVGWRVPDRLTQEAALRGSSVAAPFDILVIGTTPHCYRVSSASRVQSFIWAPDLRSWIVFIPGCRRRLSIPS